MAPAIREHRQFPLVGAFGLYGAAFALIAWPWLSGAVTIPWDAKSQFFPQLAFLARALAEGQSPFWAPNVYAGWPQIADPQSLIFSPLHALLALVDSAPGFRAADAVVFAFLFLGGAGIILMFRERGWHMGGALVAALAFAFGGSNAARLQHIGQIESLAYLPLALFLLTRALERRSLGWGAAAGLAVGLIAIGRDQVALLSLYVLAGFVLWHWLDGAGRWARLRVSIRPLAASAAAGAVVAAVPVLLTALLAVDSNRPATGFEVAARGSLHPANLLTLVFADLFGAADPKVDYWGAPSLAWHAAFGSTDLFHAQNIGQLYAGAIVVVALIGFGVVRGQLWNREIRFFTIATVVLLLYALGKYTPAFRGLYELLPGVALYRRPADATFVFGALLTIVAGYLVHRWLSVPMLWPRRGRWTLPLLIAAAVTAVALGLAGAIGVLRDALLPIVNGLVFAGAAVAVLIFARWLALGGTPSAALVLAAFSVADLAWNNAPNESTGLPPSVYDALRVNTHNETVVLLKRTLAVAAPERRDRVELIAIGYHWPNIGLVHGFDHLFGHNPLRLRDFARATGVADTVATPDQRGFAPLLPSYRSPMEALFGVRLIATGVPVEEVDRLLKPGDLRELARTQDARVYENPRALPRVMLLTDWRIANFEELQRQGFPADIDTQRTVLLERAPASLSAGAGAGTARLVRYGNAEVVTEVEAPAGGILLLNDIWHPWWRAEVDDAPAEILKANVLFRAVAVPPGKHTVRFRFHPFAGAFAQLGEMLGGRR